MQKKFSLKPKGYSSKLSKRFIDSSGSDFKVSINSKKNDQSR